MQTVNTTSLVIKKDKLQEVRIINGEISKNLEPNQVLLKVDTFSLTSNNITYAVIGEQMKYWQFFPAEEGYGIIPVWGFADVVVSNHPEVQVGQRFYGYYPMGSHLVVSCDKIGTLGFKDKSEHRQRLAPVYNYYSNTANDPSFASAPDGLNALFRPLFTTSFLIDHHLFDANFFGATHIIITSASSKTAQALAFLLAKRRVENHIKIIGLTSKTNVDFVRQLGWYDEAVPYDELKKLNTDNDYVIVDFTGNHEVQFQLQSKFKEKLRYNCLVGLVDWQHLRGEKPLPKKGDIFFAPTHVEHRQKEWGAVGFQQKLGFAWNDFMATVQSKLTVVEHHGFEELQKLYLALLKGEVAPDVGHVVKFE